jgi:extracellular matrix regulatory protein A
MSGGVVVNKHDPRLVNVGHGNIVLAHQIVAIVALDSLPVKRLIESVKGSTKLVDATNGRRTRAVIVTESDHLILSSLEPATLAQRLVTERSLNGD